MFISPFTSYTSVHLVSPSRAAGVAKYRSVHVCVHEVFISPYTSYTSVHLVSHSCAAGVAKYRSVHFCVHKVFISLFTSYTSVHLVTSSCATNVANYTSVHFCWLNYVFILVLICELYLRHSLLKEKFSPSVCRIHFLNNIENWFSRID